MNITAYRLRELRQNSGLSQQKVADALGINRTSYNKYEKGIINPVRKINELAEFFGVTADYLLGREATSFEKYLNLDNKSKEIVDIVIDALYEREHKSPVKNFNNDDF